MVNNHFTDFSIFTNFNFHQTSPADTGDVLHFYLRSVLKGETDIFFIKNCDKINQAIPEVLIKLRPAVPVQQGTFLSAPFPASPY